jgi:hypothetical protein
MGNQLTFKMKVNDGDWGKSTQIDKIVTLISSNKIVLTPAELQRLLGEEALNNNSAPTENANNQEQ